MLVSGGGGGQWELTGPSWKLPEGCVCLVLFSVVFVDVFVRLTKHLLVLVS